MWLPPNPAYHLLPGAPPSHPPPSKIALAVFLTLGPMFYFLPGLWRFTVAGLIMSFVLYGLCKCWTSEACAGVGPLIMLMPGARLGATLVVIVIMMTIFLPFVSNMWEAGDLQTNPIAFFLILPCLVFAVLFWGMTLHWVSCSCATVSQRRGGKPRKKLTSNLILAPGELAVGRRFTKDVAEGERLP